MQLKMNIIIMGVNGFIGNFGHYKSNLEHSMRGSDDATILLLILAINKRMINPSNLLLMSNDKKILLITEIFHHLKFQFIQI